MATTVSAFSDYRRESQKKGSGVPRSFTMLEKYKLLLGAGRGMAFLHSRGYIHCDIKSPNFLIAKVLSNGVAGAMCVCVLPNRRNVLYCVFAMLPLICRTMSSSWRIWGMLAL